MFYKLLVRISFIYLMLVIASCSKHEYTPQDVRSIGVIKERESELLLVTRKAVAQLGFNKTIEMTPFSKDGVKKYSILLKSRKSFVNLKNIYTEKCMDVAVYLEEPSLEKISEIYEELESEIKENIPEYRDQESIYLEKCE